MCALVHRVTWVWNGATAFVSARGGTKGVSAGKRREVTRNIFFLVAHLSGARGFLQTLSALKRAFTFEPGPRINAQLFPFRRRVRNWGGRPRGRGVWGSF